MVSYSATTLRREIRIAIWESIDRGEPIYHGKAEAPADAASH